MIRIKIKDNNNVIEINDNKVMITNELYDLDNKLVIGDEKVIYDFIIRIIKITSGWKKQSIVMNDFENWEITIQLDETINKYSCNEYLNSDFANIRELVDQLIRKCI